jgi:HEAT repeat protein
LPYSAKIVLELESTSQVTGRQIPARVNKVSPNVKAMAQAHQDPRGTQAARVVMTGYSSDFGSESAWYLGRSGPSGQDESGRQTALTTLSVAIQKRVGVDALVGRLHNLYDGESAIPEIISQGVTAIPSLEALLRGRSEALYQSRCWAADALAHIGGDAAISALVEALRDAGTRVLQPVLQQAEDVVVYHIAEHLTSSRHPQVTEALFLALRHRPNSGCVRALGYSGNAKVIPVLVRCLVDDATRSAAATALRRIGPECTRQLVHLIADNATISGIESPSHADGRAAAAALAGEWLNCLSNDQLETVVRNALTLALTDPQRGVRLAAATALSRGDALDMTCALPLLIEMLDDPNWRRADSIMSALRGLGPLALDGLAYEAMYLKPGEAAHRRRLRAISLLGSLSSLGTQRLLARLGGDFDPEIRLAAVHALATNMACPTELLRRFLADPHFGVRRVAFSALRRRNALTAEIAIRFLGDPEKSLRRLAISSLRKNEVRARAAVVRAALKFGEPQLGLKVRSRQWWHSCWLLILA